MEDKRVLFGKYEMGRVLGKGTFAKVLLGKEISTGESVAIKVINKDQVLKRQGMMDQIKREISITKLVRHPNIVELKEVMATKTKIFFVMEYVKGGELFAKVARGKLKEDQARKYFQQLISAIDFCHSRGVSHRDLKPENLLLDENGDLKISDFGLSALPEQRRDGLLHTRCGTPAYVAPEVLRKKGYDGAKADIWSCGVVLYVLLAGFLPFQNENVMSMYRKIFKAEFEFPPWFSAEARKLISKLLVVDPEKRITIPAITRTPWFRKNFTHPVAFSIGEPISSPSQNDGQKEEEDDQEEKSKLVSPKFFNAFDFISTMSSGFDLSSLFESKKKPKSTFTSKFSAKSILAKIETAVTDMNFKVRRTRDFKMKMQGRTEGRKGRLSVTAEVFEVAPEVAVVEFSMCSGDTLEYNKFCEEQVRPALKDIVWTWQGETCSINNSNIVINNNSNNDISLSDDCCGSTNDSESSF